MPLRVDVTWYRGADWSRVVQLLPGCPDPGSIASWSLLATLRDNWAPNGTVLATSVPTIQDGVLRQFTVAFTGTQLLLPTAAQLSALPAGTILTPTTYYWDVSRTDSGFSWPLLVGEFVINPVAKG